MNDNSISIVNRGGSIGAIGRNSQGIVNNRADSNPKLTEVGRKLAELRRLLEQNSNQLDDREVAKTAVAEAEREIESSPPQNGKLRMLLSAISGAAPGVTAVADAVKAIKDLLGGP
jgi:hypothetical protein